ncbi:unnamed protein product [Parajaminaea phylloscopi]
MAPSATASFTTSSSQAASSSTQVSEVASFGEQHIARGVSRLTTNVLKKGSGTWVWNDQGRKILDLTCGIGVTNLGHCHPRVSEAAKAQVDELVHAQCAIGYSEKYVELIRAMLPTFAKIDPRLDSVFFWNSGSEAVEASIKLAREVTGKNNVIVVQGSYHGRTYGAMALTKSKTIYSERQGPLMPGVFVTSFPFYSQLGLPPTTPTSELVAQSLHQLRLLLAQQTAPSETAAILLEPVMGEGGYVPAPKEFLQGLRQISEENGILLIHDEVQSGAGRTGDFWATESSGVKPDIMIFAKGIANGFPLSGIVSRQEIMDKQKPGTMGGTYAGNAVSCAAGLAVIETFEKERVLDNVAARSQQLFAFLEDLKSSSPAGNLIEDIRGRGLMVGLQFKRGPISGDSNHAATRGLDWVVDGAKREQLAPKISKRCAEKGMLILSTSVFDVMRFIPPLNITEDELAQACQIFRESFEEVAKEDGRI